VFACKYFGRKKKYNINEMAAVKSCNGGSLCKFVWSLQVMDNLGAQANPFMIAVKIQ
jgi:hypothetical protein